MTTQNSISSIVHPCNLCSEQFDDPNKLARHKWRRHVNAVQVVHEGITISCSKTENEFICPIDNCNRTYKSTNGFQSHLNAAHNASLSTVSKLTGDDNKSGDEELSLPSNMTKQWSHLGETHAIDNEMSGPTSLNYEEAILSASDALHADAKVKKRKILLSECGEWAPMSIQSFNPQHTHYVLGDATVIRSIVATQPQGKFDLVLANPLRPNDLSNTLLPQSTTETYLKHTLRSHRFFCNQLAHRKYEPISTELISFINEDWHLCPQMRYAVATLFAGAIIMDPHQILVVNTVEMYGRMKTMDVHHEQHWRTASLPNSAKDRYKRLTIAVDNYGNNRKLIIGTLSCTMLVTSSILLKNNSVKVQVGPSTFQYIPADPTIFVDIENVMAAKSLFNQGKECWRTNESDVLCQLRQVRSKFHRLSTYTLCRASSYSTANFVHKPLSIWTFANQQGTMAAESNAKQCSKLFQAIALEVIQNAKQATLEKRVVVEIRSNVEEGNHCHRHLTTIVQSFGEATRVSIIDNINLEKPLQELANIVTYSLKNANAIVAKRIEEWFTQTS